jgi:hypothetical protein
MRLKKYQRERRALGSREIMRSRANGPPPTGIAARTMLQLTAPTRARVALSMH